MKAYAIVTLVLISLVMVYMFVFRKKENYSSNVGMMYMTSLSQLSNTMMRSNVSSNVVTQINKLTSMSRNAITQLTDINNTQAALKGMITRESPMVQNTFSQFSTTYFPNGSVIL